MQISETRMVLKREWSLTLFIAFKAIECQNLQGFFLDPRGTLKTRKCSKMPER